MDKIIYLFSRKQKIMEKICVPTLPKIFRPVAQNTLIFMPPKELWEAYSNRTVRPSIPLRVWCISPKFFEVGIPNLVCGCILGWRSVGYHFRVTVTLTSDLVFIVVTMSVCLSVRPASCPVHFSYIL